MRQKLRMHVLAYRALFERSLRELRDAGLLDRGDPIGAGEFELLDRAEQQLRMPGASPTPTLGELHKVQRAIVATAHVVGAYGLNGAAPLAAYANGYAIAVLRDVRRAHTARLIVRAEDVVRGSLSEDLFELMQDESEAMVREADDLRRMLESE